MLLIKQNLLSNWNKVQHQVIRWFKAFFPHYFQPHQTPPFTAILYQAFNKSQIRLNGTFLILKSSQPLAHLKVFLLIKFPWEKFGIKKMDGRITPEYKLSEALFLPYGNNLFSQFLKHFID